MNPALAHLVASELQLTRPGERVTFHGESMAPFLRDGDELSVEPVVWAEIAVGDVVTCRLDDRFPTLRVVAKHASRLVLRGDHWPFADFQAWREDVIGRVTSRHRAGATVTPRDWRWRARTGAALADDRLRRIKRRTRREAHRVHAGIGRRLRQLVSPLGEPPVGLHVNISASCNLGCKMCPYLGVHDDPGYVRTMDEETFARLLPALSSIPTLTLSGSGEPLFNQQLVRFIERAREANPRIDVDLTTNGTLLTERIAREFVRAGLTRLIVSIDGATERTVSAIRIGINLEKVLDNVRTMARVKAETGSQRPHVWVNYMIGYGSYDELPAFVRSARSLGVEEIRLLEVLTGTEEAVRNDLKSNLSRDGGRTLREAIRIAEAAGVRLVTPTMDPEACLHPSTPHVSESGDVSPCCYVDYEGRTLWEGGRSVQMPRLEYGNVTRRSFAEIWTSKAFATLRARDKRGDFPDFCRTCQSVRAATSSAIHRVLD